MFIPKIIIAPVLALLSITLLSFLIQTARAIGFEWWMAPLFIVGLIGTVVNLIWTVTEVIALDENNRKAKQ